MSFDVMVLQLVSMMITGFFRIDILLFLKL
jgi:hypothetical protein